MKTLFTLILALLAGTVFGQTGQWVQALSGCKVLTFRNGNVSIEWLGNCENGLANGTGPMRLYVDNILEVFGVVTYKQGMLNGQNRINFEKGGGYDGEFVDGLQNGQGKLELPNRDKYVGEFKNGKPNGKGTYTFAKQGKQHIGLFKDGKLNGSGTVIFHDGEKVFADFKDGIANGQENYSFANGNKYVGELDNDRPNGQGTMTYANGDKYVGEFKNGSPNGQGTLTNANGDRYSGLFSGGRFLQGDAIVANSDKTANSTNISQTKPLKQKNNDTDNLKTSEFATIYQEMLIRGELSQDKALSSTDIQTWGICMNLITLVIASELKGSPFDIKYRDAFGKTYGVLAFYRKYKLSHGYSESNFTQAIKSYSQESLSDSTAYFKNYGVKCIKVGQSIDRQGVK